MSPPAEGTRPPDARAGSDAPPDLAPEAGAVDAAPSSPSPSPCANLPSGPIAITRVPGIDPAEDITFDDSGNLYWHQLGGGIVRSRADGSSALFVPQVEIVGGMRWTPAGDIYVATSQSVEKVSPNGARTMVLSGHEFNGIEVDRQGRVYATEVCGTRIFRYDPASKHADLISKDVVQRPNGLTFNPAFDMLYVSNYLGHDKPTLHRIAIQPNGTPGKTEVWVTGVGNGTFDGMAADECGNIYVANSDGAGEILRIAPDGKTHTVLVKRAGETLHNFMWGRGQGWSENKLYIVSLGQGLFEADVGVRGKKYW
jgi:sugar lactone lactonase YvrE